MNQATAAHHPGEWGEAKKRVEIYLRAMYQRIGPAEEQLIAEAISMACERRGFEPATHPVTLVMESLFSFLPALEVTAPVAMAPPIRRVSMIPEPTEFPLHKGIARLFRGQLIPFAGVR